MCETLWHICCVQYRQSWEENGQSRAQIWEARCASRNSLSFVMYMRIHLGLHSKDTLIEEHEDTWWKWVYRKGCFSDSDPNACTIWKKNKQFACVSTFQVVFNTKIATLDVFLQYWRNLQSEVKVMKSTLSLVDRRMKDFMSPVWASEMKGKCSVDGVLCMTAASIVNVLTSRWQGLIHKSMLW